MVTRTAMFAVTVYGLAFRVGCDRSQSTVDAGDVLTMPDPISVFADQRSDHAVSAQRKPS